MQIWAESGKSALPICNYSQILYQFLTFTQNLKRSQFVVLKIQLNNPKRFPKAVQCLENGLEDSLTFYAFPKLDARKISSSNMIEQLNREIRRRTSVVGIFPNEASYVRLVTTYLMEYAEDWSVSRAYLSQDSIEATLLIAA